MKSSGTTIKPVVVRRAPYFVERAVEEAARRFDVPALGDAGYSLLSTLDWSDHPGRWHGRDPIRCSLL